MKRQHRTKHRTGILLTGVLIFMTVLGIQATALADMRIVIENTISMQGRMTGDSDTQELLFKDNRIVIPQGDGTHILVHCTTGDFSFVAPNGGVYWRGTAADFVGEFKAIMDEMAQHDPDMDFSWLVDMFDPDTPSTVAVRTTQIGDDNAGGYDAVQYRVEYEQNGTWRHHEDIWLSAAVLQQIGTEMGNCLNTVARDVQQTMVGLFAGEMTDLFAVFTSPEYNALTARGFPVRNETEISQFGITILSISQVISISDAPLDEAMFVVPDHFERISVLEMMM